MQKELDELSSIEENDEELQVSPRKDE